MLVHIEREPLPRKPYQDYQADQRQHRMRRQQPEQHQQKDGEQEPPGAGSKHWRSVFTVHIAYVVASTGTVSSNCRTTSSVVLPSISASGRMMSRWPSTPAATA